MFADVQTPERRPTRATRATCCAAPRSARRRWASTYFNVGPELEYYLFRDNRATEVARRGRLLRPHDARRRLRRPPRHGARARAARHRRRVLPPRGRAVPARDRHALLERAEDGRRLHDLPHHGQGVRDQVRLARDVHAQAAVRPERLGHAHAPVAVQGRPQRVLRRRRQVLPVRRRQGVHRRPAAPRARDLLDLRPVGELLQAARARATRRRSTSPGHAATAPRWCASRSTTPARRTRRAWSCARPIPPATRT